MAIDRVLMVCVGNLCRSPMAVALLRHQLAEDTRIVVESAGLAAMAGNPIDALAESVLAEHGIACGHHIARQLDAAQLERAGLVLVMDWRQRAALFALAPWARKKLFLLGRWLGDLEIPDPYGKPREAFERTFQMIEPAVRSWLPHL